MEEELIIFNDFINNYDLNIKQLKMKEEHTYRVVEYAKNIAISLNLPNEDVKLACTCALFHDLGRFPQFSEYQTFHDSLSFDHGDKAYELLKKMNYNNEIVLNAVKFHNKYNIAECLSEREKLFCNITRDADKLDILISEELVDNDDEYDIDDEVYKYLFNHKMVPNSTKYKSKETFEMLRSIGFIYDLNFKKSFEILNELRTIQNKIECIYNIFFDTRLMILNASTKKYISERVGENVRKKVRS